jgi:hypothetical protein
VGSAGVAAWIAYFAFVVLVAYGFATGELGLRGLTVAVLSCVLAGVALSYVPNGESMVFSAVAVVDIALVIIIFKSDLRL